MDHPRVPQEPTDLDVVEVQSSGVLAQVLAQVRLLEQQRRSRSGPERSPDRNQDKKTHKDVLVASTTAHHVFEDEGQRLAGVDDVVKDDDVGVFQTLEERS